MKKSARHIIPAAYAQMRDNVLLKDNLTGISASKAHWARDLGLSREAEVTFFAGCGYQQMRYVEGMMSALRSAGKVAMNTEKLIGINRMLSRIGVDMTTVAAKITASKDDPYTPVLKSSVSVLKKLGIVVGYLHEDEPCCGAPMYYAGFEEDYAAHARANYRALKSLGVKRIIGLVPGCTSALRDTYPKYVEDYDLEVRHILEVIAKRLKETGQRAVLSKKTTVIYHDPCQLSRYLQITEEPRAIIRRIEGAELLEGDPEQFGRWSTCCGGGGIEATQAELSERVGLRRAEELLKSEAALIISNCPACEMQLRKILTKLNSDVKVVDLISFLDAALE